MKNLFMRFSGCVERFGGPSIYRRSRRVESTQDRKIFFHLEAGCPAENGVGKIVRSSFAGGTKLAPSARGHRLDPGLLRVQALVLCPTRELSDQVAKVILRLAAGMPNIKVSILTGGNPLAPQLATLRKDPHVVVGTPGRIEELMSKHVLSLAKVRTLVLDEADRMLDMGFEEPIREIVGHTPPSRQSLLLSATYPEAIRKMPRGTLRDPLEVTVAAQRSTRSHRGRCQRRCRHCASTAAAATSCGPAISSAR
jgi:hypothetical protein